jgi:hypothetical protein
MAALGPSILWSIAAWTLVWVVAFSLDPTDIVFAIIPLGAFLGFSFVAVRATRRAMIRLGTRRAQAYTITLAALLFILVPALVSSFVFSVALADATPPRVRLLAATLSALASLYHIAPASILSAFAKGYSFGLQPDSRHVWVPVVVSSALIHGIAVAGLIFGVGRFAKRGLNAQENPG